MAPSGPPPTRSAEAKSQGRRGFALPVTAPERVSSARNETRTILMKDIRWGWVLLGALLADVAVTLLVVPVALLDGYEHLGYVAPTAAFVGVLVVAYWIARKASQRAVLHGLLVGLVAMLIYIPVELADEVTFAHALSSLLKVLGGVVGGFVVARRAAVKPTPTP